MTFNSFGNTLIKHLLNAPMHQMKVNVNTKAKTYSYTFGINQGGSKKFFFRGPLVEKSPKTLPMWLYVLVVDSCELADIEKLQRGLRLLHRRTSLLLVYILP